MDKTQTMNVAYDRIKFIDMVFCMSSIYSYDHEIMQLTDERIDMVDLGGEQATNNFQLFFNKLNLASKQVVQICNQVSNLYDATTTTTSTQASKGSNTNQLAQVKV